MNLARGDVVIGPDFMGGSSRRPFLIISDSTHPFNSEEAIVVAITTTERSEAISLPDKKFVSGGLPKESFVSPWTVTTLKKDDMRKKLEALNEETVNKISKQVKSYV